MWENIYFRCHWQAPTSIKLWRLINIIYKETNVLNLLVCPTREGGLIHLNIEAISSTPTVHLDHQKQIFSAQTNLHAFFFFYFCNLLLSHPFQPIFFPFTFTLKLQCLLQHHTTTPLNTHDYTNAHCSPIANGIIVSFKPNICTMALIIFPSLRWIWHTALNIHLCVLCKNPTMLAFMNHTSELQILNSSHKQPPTSLQETSFHTGTHHIT